LGDVASSHRRSGKASSFDEREAGRRHWSDALRGGLPRWARQCTDLLQDACDVHYRPILNDLAVTDAVDRDPFGLDLPVRRRNSEKFTLVNASAHDVADDEIALRHLHGDFVASRGSHTEDLRRLLHP